MRLGRGILGLTCALAACLTIPAQAATNGPLDHSGRWLTDSDGRVVVLHGVNMVFKRPPYVPADTGFGDDDAAFLAEHGFNTVRLGVIYTAVEPQPGVYDDAYLDRIAETVAVLGRHGIYVQLDFHQDLYNERFQGEGFPDWAVQDDGLPAQPQTGFPGNYLLMPALNRAFDHFWANDPGPGGVGLQDRFAAAWGYVAQRFRSEPALMGYDILNEPWPGSAYPTCTNPIGCPVFDQGPLAGLTRRVMDAIRAKDSRNIVWYEPNVIFNNGSDTHHPDTGDPRAGFSFHYYCLPAGVIPGVSLPNPPRDDVCEVQEDLVLENAERHIGKTGDAQLISEFGATDDLALIETVVDSADEARMNWQYWHYCECADPTTSGVGGVQSLVPDPSKPPTGDNVKVDKLKVLARPFPRSVAGTPGAWDFDPATRKFTLRYATESPAGGRLPREVLTEVFVPRLHYPGGYDVQVRGARMVSRPGAQSLLLRRDRSAGEVTLRLAPR